MDGSGTFVRSRENRIISPTVGLARRTVMREGVETVPSGYLTMEKGHL